MDRRTFLVSTVGAVLAPGVSPAQQRAKVYRVGYLHLASPPIASFEIIVRALQELGYTEGKNIHYEPRYGYDRIEQLPPLAAELVRLKVDVIVAIANTAAFAAKAATSTIPIVLAGIHGAVESGLVATLRAPGGNITGTESLAPELDAKRLELLHEMLPTAARLAVISNPLDQGTPLHNKWSGAAAEKLGITLQTFSVRSRGELDAVFAGIKKMRPDGILLLAEALIYSLRNTILEFALANRLPVVSEFGLYTELGGLLSYGPTPQSLFGGAARYIDKILKGAKPAELSIQQPTELELAVNSRVAKALRITIPQKILVLANRVIE